MISIDLSGCLSPPLPETRGVSDSVSGPFENRARDSLEALVASPPGFARILDDDTLLPPIADLADRLSCRHVVVLGIGGSGLGTRTLQAALGFEASQPRVTVLDNIDPHTVSHLASTLELEHTLFVAISKSGSTAETVSQALYFRGCLRDAGIEDWSRHFVFVTDPEAGPLRELASREGIETLPVPGDVGGRFSVLTAVGLFPAALMGLDVAALVGGARELWSAIRRPDSPEGATITRLVATHCALAFDRGATIQVLMTYCDRLRTFGDWYSQLWAESLGKRWSRDGEEVHRGSTPLSAVGATDQHSLVQLFVEGPADKQFIFLRVEDPGASAAIPTDAGLLHEDFAYLAGSSIERLFAAEREGTVRGLRAAQRPCVEIAIDRVDESHLGALFFLFELMTALAGDLYDVNPYDQPGVEAGKIAAFALMDRPGYAEKARRVLGSPPAEPRFFRLPPQ